MYVCGGTTSLVCVTTLYIPVFTHYYNTFNSSNLVSVSAESLSRELILSAHFFVSLLEWANEEGETSDETKIVVIIIM